MEAGANNVD